MTDSSFFEIPIEIRALRTATVYIITTDSSRFLVDTGMRSSSMDEISKLGVDLSKLDGIIITHLHIDHVGGASAIKKKYGTQIVMGKRDAEICHNIGENHHEYLEFLEQFYRENGVDQKVLTQLMRDHPMHMEYSRYSELEFDQMVERKDHPLGDKQIDLLVTPGHSPGSISPVTESGEIFAGDLVLKSITPNISFYDESTDMLSLYLESIGKLRKGNYRKVNPGHGVPFSDLKGRIDEIRNHHMQRLDEVLQILGGGEKTAFQVTLEMRWSRGRVFQNMNEFEKNFAFGEAVSHLRKLQADGKVETSGRNGVTYYRKSAGESGFS